MYDTLLLSILCFHGQTIASITHHSNVTLIHRNSFNTVALRIVLGNYSIRGNRSGGWLVNIGIEYHIQVFKNNSDRNGWSKSWCKRRTRLCNHWDRTPNGRRSRTLIINNRLLRSPQTFCQPELFKYSQLYIHERRVKDERMCFVVGFIAEDEPIRRQTSRDQYPPSIKASSVGQLISPIQLN